MTKKKVAPSFTPINAIPLQDAADELGVSRKELKKAIYKLNGTIFIFRKNDQEEFISEYALPILEKKIIRSK